MNAPAVQEFKSRLPKRRKWPRRVLWGMLSVILAAVGFWCWSYWSALAERDALIAEIRARGEPVWWHEVIERLTSSPQEESGSETFRLAMWELGAPFNQNGSVLPSATLDALSRQKAEPKEDSDVQKELRQAAHALATAEKSTTKPPGLLFNGLIRDEPFIVNIDPMAGSFRNVLRMLRWRSFDALARGDADAAYRSARLTLLCADQMANEPMLCLQHIRNASLGWGCNQLTMCLEYARTPDAEYRLLDERLANLTKLDFDANLIAERAMLLDILENDRALLERLKFLGVLRKVRGTPDPWYAARWDDVLSSKLALPARLRTQIEIIRLVDRIRALTKNSPVDRHLVTEACNEFERRSAMHRLLSGSTRFLIEWMEQPPLWMESTSRRLILARLALRLRRHYDLHGSFPESLQPLCDASMPTIPLKWFHNEPIVYNRSANGFRLELPESIVPDEARYRLRETPILSDWGLDLELKTLTKPGTAK